LSNEPGRFQPFTTAERINVSTTLDHPQTSRNLTQKRSRHPPAILGSFPDKRHVEYYKAQRRAEESARLCAQPKPSKAEPTSVPNDRDDFVSAVIELLSKLKPSRPTQRHQLQGSHNWYEQLQQLRDKQRRDHLGRTIEDVQTILRLRCAP